MAATRRQLNIAFAELSPENQRPLRSAIGVTSVRLDVDFQWSSLQDADICIVDITRRDPNSVDAVTIRYTERQNGRAVDLVRPVHVKQLLQALRNAIDEVDRRQAEASSQPKPRRYRGAIVDSSEKPASASATPSKPAKAVIYRGVRVR